jgi:hypothetical protein
MNLRPCRQCPTRLDASQMGISGGGIFLPSCREILRGRCRRRTSRSRGSSLTSSKPDWSATTQGPGSTRRWSLRITSGSSRLRLTVGRFGAAREGFVEFMRTWTEQFDNWAMRSSAGLTPGKTGSSRSLARRQRENRDPVETKGISALASPTKQTETWPNDEPRRVYGLVMRSVVVDSAIRMLRNRN